MCLSVCVYQRYSQTAKVPRRFITIIGESPTTLPNKNHPLKIFLLLWVVLLKASKDVRLVILTGKLYGFKANEEENVMV